MKENGIFVLVMEFDEAGNEIDNAPWFYDKQVPFGKLFQSLADNKILNIATCVQIQAVKVGELIDFNFLHSREDDKVNNIEITLNRGFLEENLAPQNQYKILELLGHILDITYQEWEGGSSANVAEGQYKN